MKHIRLTIRGIVREEGYIPFIYKEAILLNLNGFVENTINGILISIEGNNENIFKFIDNILVEYSSLKKLEFFKLNEMNLMGYKSFIIMKSDDIAINNMLLPQDIATCKKCEQEILNYKLMRRYNYPFNNCRNCGPRYTIIQKIPYNRKNTIMDKFNMCIDCQKEYRDPIDRRFHNESICCNNCGPQISIWNKNEKIQIEDRNIFSFMQQCILQGNIIAIKGIGGFNIICNGKSNNTILKLRKKLNRPNKPFSIMFKDIDTCKNYCNVNLNEEEILIGSKKPILLLNKKNIRDFKDISSSNKIGVLLPYEPLHYMLFSDKIDYIVFTSGCHRDMTIEYKNLNAIDNLNDICDYFLIHNRDINTPIYDSIVRVIDNDINLYRPGRGYAPYSYKTKINNNILAIGSLLNNTFSFSLNNRIFLSPYNGDLNCKENIDFFKKILNHFISIYNLKNDIIAIDINPIFNLSDKNKTIIRTYHHHAHIASCIGENNIKGAVIGIVYDENGYGEDGNIWGSEFLVSSLREFKRVGHITYFNLIGGVKAIVNPWIVAYDLCSTYLSDKCVIQSFFYDVDKKELDNIVFLKKNKLDIVKTSSMARLFDAVAFLLGFNHEVTYEGETTIYLENLAYNSVSTMEYEYEILSNSIYEINLNKIVNGITNDLILNVDKCLIARKFHNTIVKFTVELVNLISKKTGLLKVALSGVVFENEILKIGIKSELAKHNFQVFFNSLIPTNDSGISIGQVLIANEIYNKK